MSAVWSITSLESGRFSAIERCSEIGELEFEVNGLRARGQGYLEVRLPDSSFPRLTLSFRDDHAVVHLFTDEERMFLLAGDGAVSPENALDFPVMDELAPFTGDFILAFDRAWSVVQSFIESGTFERQGEWREL